MATIICPRCGTANDAGAMNCRQCRVNLRWALENLAEVGHLKARDSQPHAVSLTEQQVNKSIRQMRQMFGFFGIMTGLSVLLSLAGIASDPDVAASSLVGYGLLCACFWVAFVNLGKRNKTGYTFARICSIIFLFGFPLLTIFGLSYLNKLSKPEMKAALGVIPSLQSLPGKPNEPVAAQPIAAGIARADTVMGAVAPSGQTYRRSENMTWELILAGGQRFPLREGVMSIGRAEESDIRLVEPSISRRHAQIQCQGNQCWITDLGSTNGTFVNEYRLPPYQPYAIDPSQALSTRLRFGTQTMATLASSYTVAISEPSVSAPTVVAPPGMAVPRPVRAPVRQRDTGRRWVAALGIVALLLVVGWIIWFARRNATSPPQTSGVIVAAVTSTPTAGPALTRPPVRATARPSRTPTRTPTPRPTRTPTRTPTRRPTRTPTPLPDAVVSVDVGNLRAGPGTNYDIIGKVKEGDWVEILSRNNAGDWVEVTVTMVTGQRTGWLSVSLLDLNIPLSSVGVAARIPPTPTPRIPTATPTPKVCPPNPSLVQVCNYLDASMRLTMSGPESLTITVAKGGKKNICIRPGTYSSTLSASGYYTKRYTKSFTSSEAGDCTCWSFYNTGEWPPDCNCPTSMSSYSRP